MYISLMFITYIAASFVALLGLGMVLLLVSKNRATDSKQYRMAMIFAAIVFALCVLYFVMYFKDMVLKQYEVNTVVRALDYLLFGGVFFFWIRTVGALRTEKKNSIILWSWIVGGIDALTGIIATVFFMDETYNFASIELARTFTVIEGLTILLTVIVVGVFTFEFLRESVSKRKKIYVCLVSVTLMLWDILQIPIDSSLYFGMYDSAWTNGVLDVTGAAMTIVSLANFVYLFREDFSPLFYIKNAENIEVEDVDPVQLAALQHHLTVREEEVLRLAYEGKNNPVIAEELFISTNTVKKHMKSIYEKLGVSTRMELVYIVNSGKNLENTK